MARRALDGEAAGEAAATLQRDAAAVRPVRVCIVAPSLDLLGGQAVQAQRLLAAFAASDRVHVAFLAVNPRLPGPLRALQRIKYLRTVVTSIAYVASLLSRARDYDVLHVFSASYWSFLLAPLPALLVGRLYGRPTLLNYRSGEAPDHLANWRTARWGVRQATRVIVPSGYLVGVFGEYGVPAQSIPNFVDVSRIPFRARSPLRPVFLSNRNFEAHYNVSCTLRAFAAIQAQVPDATLTVVGDGPQRRELEALAASLGLRGVAFTGQVPPERMPALYDAADIYLNSPELDNMPTSIIEAFAAGLPVVTTNAGGIPFIVRHGDNGRMVARGDAGQMAREARALLADPDGTLAMTRRARGECEARYVWPAVRTRWEELYREVARGAARAAGPRA
jgi:glycosyltransferase involved in cell wall biosynthesis